jgi:hypothetical protein
MIFNKIDLKTFFLLFSIIILLNSCISFFGFQKRNYSYQYKSFAKNIDLSRGNWLLTPISSTSFGINEDASYNLLKEFLTSKLGNRLKISSKLKDKNNKYLMPFNINFDNLKENISFLKKSSKCDYIISSKVYYLDDTRDIGVGQYRKNKNLKSNGYKSACKISIIAYDLKTEEEIFNLDCLGYIWVDGELDEGLKIYQTSKSASADVMTKIIKKLKKR